MRERVMHLIVILLIIINTSVYAQKRLGMLEFLNGRIVRLGEPSKIMNVTKQDTTEYYYIKNFDYKNVWQYSGGGYEIDSLKSLKAYYESLFANKDIGEDWDQENFIWGSALKMFEQSKFISKDFIVEKKIFPSNKFMIDTLIVDKGIIYLVVYWIDDRGFLYSPKENFYIPKIYGNRPEQNYTFIIKDPENAIKEGEIILTDEFYIEPISIQRPTRAVTLFIQRSSRYMLIIILFIYCLILFIYNKISITRKLNYEIATGSTFNINKKEYYSNNP